MFLGRHGEFSFEIVVTSMKYLKQSKEIKQKWKGSKYFDICFSVMFSLYDQSLISERKIGH